MISSCTIASEAAIENESTPTVRRCCMLIVDRPTFLHFSLLVDRLYADAAWMSRVKCPGKAYEETSLGKLRD